MSISYKGAWWVDTPSAITALSNAGFNLFLIPYLSATQVANCLISVPAGNYSVVLLIGTPDEKKAQITSLKGSSVFGYVLWDEPNVGGTLLDIPTQIAYYQAAKAIDSLKMIFASYHLEPAGPSNPNYIVPVAGHAWDYAMLNFYPAVWGRTDAQAGTALTDALTHAHGIFDVGSQLIGIEQAAGLSCPTGGVTRPIPGLLQAQHNIWASSSLINTNAYVYYGWGTNPEDWNLQTPAVLAEAAAVS